jgi:hypothetical protein
MLFGPAKAILKAFGFYYAAKPKAILDPVKAELNFNGPDP